MQNQLNTQYYPQLQPAGSAQACPSSSVGAVNIQIYNPTASPAQGFYQPCSCAPYPCNYNNIYAAPAHQQTYNPQPVQNTAQTDLNLNNNQNGIAAQGEGKEGSKTEEKKEVRTKVELTDDYIKTLENYLNSQDKKIRLMGANELLNRFKEDETRKDDAALTALLNKTLQDPAETVKFVGLTALDTGYADGNDETVKLLQNMQSSETSYGEDASLASRILLKMSGRQANVQAAALNPVNEPELADNSVSNEKLPPSQDGILLNGGQTENKAVA